ncbi:MAG: hypothetical protein BSOLF_1456 [Candidatus Carbobacillus altaicus]|uniref:Dihydrodiol dehydrogenase n=1 Tax=Candidatus Carbonibacillus altaicus TaxID=2163959 RepID=A0A2R6XZF2_9BACL|nr:MAG: hypothetical protein BSOLF_1456 [Candidatus Carbobacillus altaicus]
MDQVEKGVWEMEHLDGQLDGQIDEKAPAIVIGNEFTQVIIRKVYTRNGERLEIFSPKLDRTIWLDPLALESLTWQEPEVFTSFLAKPFGY